MPYQRNIYQSLIYSLSSLFLSCAAVMIPPGGPIDTTPPLLLESIPPHGTVNFKGGEIQLIFSEYLDENSIQNSINISPAVSEKIDIVYNGKVLVIDFSDSLLTNQTYIISINRNLSDEHKVTLEEPVQIAFSTGIKIDQSLISGKIYSTDQAVVQLWKLTSSLDSSKIYEENPDYVIDANNDGDYTFKFISPGSYKIAAVSKMYSGLPISSNKVKYGLSSKQTLKIAEQDTLIGINIRIPEHIGGNRISNINLTQELWGNITFERSIKYIPDEIPFSLIGIDSMEISLNTFNDLIDDTKVHFLLEEPIDSNTIIKSPGLYIGNSTLIDSGTIRIQIDKFDEDTTSLSIIHPKGDYIHSIRSDSITPLKVVFSDLIQIHKDIQPFLIIKDSTNVSFNYELINPRSVSLIPLKNWKPKTNYTIHILGNYINPAHKRILKDSLTVIKFKTSDYQGFGSLKINLLDEFPEQLMAELNDFEKSSVIFSDKIDSQKVIYIEKILKGNYSLMLFNDKDLNNIYTHGTTNNNKSSEWFYFYPDTIKIRPNWEIEIDQLQIGSFK